MHNYAIMARGEDALEVKGMINLVLVKKDILISMLDVKIVRGIGRSFSDHHAVLCKVRLVGA